MLNICFVRFSVCTVSQGKASEFSKVIGNKINMSTRLVMKHYINTRNQRNLGINLYEMYKPYMKKIIKLD